MSKPASACSTLDSTRSDSFERNYVIKWLTALVCHLGSDEQRNWSSDSDSEDFESLLIDAAALIAICAGTASAGVISRVFTVTSPHCGQLSIQLRDVPLDNHDYGSVGAQTWGGACVLAEMIAEHPEAFDLPTISGETLGCRKTFRVLELGAGTGLVSLTIASLFRSMQTKFNNNHLPVDAVATDYYPSVLENLRVNISNNRFGENDFSSTAPESVSSVRLQSLPLDWSIFPRQPSPSAPLDQPFDLIFGADIVYEEQHAFWIKSCLETLLRKPTKSSDPHWFHLIIPLRSTHTFESSTIETVFAIPPGAEIALVIHSKETIICDDDGGDEVEYAYYKIGWSRWSSPSY